MSAYNTDLVDLLTAERYGLPSQSQQLAAALHHIEQLRGQLSDANAKLATQAAELAALRPASAPVLRLHAGGRRRKGGAAHGN